MRKQPGGKSPDSGRVRYRDRPADEGKHGDAADEPTPALPGAGVRGAQRKPAKRRGR